MMSGSYVFVSCVCLLAAGGLRAADFTVAPAGDDARPGTASEPFATLDRARRAVRELKREQPARKQPVVVRLRGGTYHLPQTLTFTPEDSGTPDAPVVYEAAPGEEPVLSAGQPVTGCPAHRCAGQHYRGGRCRVIHDVFHNKRPRSCGAFLI